jgi:deazaflavin-dependent oxidoreductase (nitroreductase family)
MNLPAVPRMVFAALNRVGEPIARSGIASMLPIGPSLVTLETIGRRTGEVRAVPLLAIRVGRHAWTATVRHGSQWVANVERRSAAHVWIGGRRRVADVDVTRGSVADVASLDIEPS